MALPVFHQGLVEAWSWQSPSTSAKMSSASSCRSPQGDGRVADIQER